MCNLPRRLLFCIDLNCTGSVTQCLCVFRSNQYSLIQCDLWFWFSQMFSACVIFIVSILQFSVTVLYISCLVTLVFMFVYLLCPFSAFPLCLPSQLCSHVFFPIPVSSPCLSVGPASCFILTVPCPLFSVFGFASSLAHYVGQTWMTRIQPIDIAIERNMFDVTHYIYQCVLGQ